MDGWTRLQAQTRPLQSYFVQHLIKDTQTHISHAVLMFWDNCTFLGAAMISLLLLKSQKSVSAASVKTFVITFIKAVVFENRIDVKVLIK